MGRITGIILATVLAIPLLGIGCVFLFLKLIEDSRKDKFGDNYERACASEMEPLECKPNAHMISQRTISEYTGLSFPDFEVSSCVSLVRDFTGDYRDRCHIRFRNPIQDDIIESILSSWTKEEYDYERHERYAVDCFTCGDKGGESDPRIYWKMTVFITENTACIEYGAN